MRHLIILICALTGVLHGQGLINPDFEIGDAGSTPAGWIATSGAGVVATERCWHGQSCVEVTPPAASVNPGILLQSIDATPYRGKLVRYRAAVRVTPEGRAGMWLRVDRRVEAGAVGGGSLDGTNGAVMYARRKGAGEYGHQGGDAPVRRDGRRHAV